MKLLPLLNGDAWFYCFSDPDSSKPLIVDAVNIPKYSLAPLQKITTTEPYRTPDHRAPKARLVLRSG